MLIQIKRCAVIGVGLLMVAGCGTSAGGSGDAAGGAKPTSDTSPRPAAKAQDLCAELGDAAMRKVSKALGGATMTDYAGEAYGITSFIPVVDKCELSYTDRPPPKPEEGEKVVYGGDTSKGEIGLKLTILPMTKRDYETARRNAREVAREAHAAAHDVSGVGAAAFYSEIESTVLVGDRLLTIDFPNPSKTTFVEVAKAIVPTVKELPPAPAKVTLPPCDPLTKAAKAALDGDVIVRRDSVDGSRTFCTWANRTTSFQAKVSGGDDPVKALAQLRSDPSVEKVKVGDEGFYLTSPLRQIIFRKGQHHYQVRYWTTKDTETIKKDMIAVARRFAQAIP